MKWIGMVHVKALKGCDVLSEGSKGAYGNVVAIAQTSDQYKKIVSAFLQEDGLLVVDFSDVDTDNKYKSEGMLSDYLKFLLDSLSEETPVQFHTFYNYHSDDA